jgi:bacterioferritin (cytochrome b1)
MYDVDIVTSNLASKCEIIHALRTAMIYCEWQSDFITSLSKLHFFRNGTFARITEY